MSDSIPREFRSAGCGSGSGLNTGQSGLVQLPSWACLQLWASASSSGKPSLGHSPTISLVCSCRSSGRVVCQPLRISHLNLIPCLKGVSSSPFDQRPRTSLPEYSVTGRRPAALQRLNQEKLPARGACFPRSQAAKPHFLSPAGRSPEL